MRAAVAVTLCCSAFAGCRRAPTPSPAAEALYAASLGAAESQVVAARAARDPAGGDIDARLADLVTRFGEGGEPLTHTTYGALASGAAARYAVPLAAGRCYRIFVVGDQRAADLDAQLREAPGAAMVDSDESYGSVAVLGLRTALCPSRGGVYELSVRAQFREATYALAVLSLDAGSARGQAQPQRYVIR